jgi:hypothetical protein
VPIGDVREFVLQPLANALLRNAMDADEFQDRFRKLSPTERLLLLEMLDRHGEEAVKGNGKV